MTKRPDVIEFEIGSVTRQMKVDVPVGPARLTDLLPIAAGMADQFASAAVEIAGTEGRQVSCCAGCGACCRQLVGISAIEARGLGEAVERMPDDRREAIEGRFDDAVQRIESAGLLDPSQPHGRRYLKDCEPGGDPEAARETSRRYFELQIACPFLDDESCSIYADRPMMCREYNVSSPAELCRTPFDSPVKKITPPVHLGASLARTAAMLGTPGVATMPLTLALEWNRSNLDDGGDDPDGETLYQTFLAQLDPEHETSLDAREPQE